MRKNLVKDNKIKLTPRLLKFPKYLQEQMKKVILDTRNFVNDTKKFSEKDKL